MATKEPGYVYILTNPSFREDWVKIGKSSRPVDVRNKILMKQTFLLFLLILLPITASADYTGDLGNGVTYTYVETTHTLTISKSGEGTGRMSKRLSFPFKREVQKVIIEDGVTYILNIFFSGYTSLTSVSIGNTVECIDKNTFKDCKSLTSIKIPNSVQYIDEGAFQGCTSLTSITIPNGVRSIKSNVFSGCTKLASVIIPKSVTYLGSRAFWNCPLERIIVGNIDIRIYRDNHVFSDRTFQYAFLYVPVGKKWDTVYGEKGLHLFKNIREIAMDSGDISTSKAYMLMNMQEHSFMMYDATNNNVSNSFNIEDNSLAQNWQIVKEDDKTYLYNLGARKFVSVSTNGDFSLTSIPIAVNLNVSEDGIYINGTTTKQWAFLVNDNVQVDASITGVIEVEAKQDRTKNFSLDGRCINQPKKGVYIIDGKKILVK